MPLASSSRVAVHTQQEWSQQVVLALSLSLEVELEVEVGAEAETEAGAV